MRYRTLAGIFFFFPCAGVAWIITVDSVRAPGANAVKGKRERKEWGNVTDEKNEPTVEFCHASTQKRKKKKTRKRAKLIVPLYGDVATALCDSLSFLNVSRIPEFSLLLRTAVVALFCCYFISFSFDWSSQTAYPCISKQQKLEHWRHESIHANYDRCTSGHKRHRKRKRAGRKKESFVLNWFNKKKTDTIGFILPPFFGRFFYSF